MYKGLKTGLAMLAFAAVAFAADNTIGTWKMNVAKSTQPPGLSPIRSLTLVRTAIPGGCDTVVKGERADGTKIASHQTEKYDGKETAVSGTGLPFDTISTTQVDANTITDHRTKKGGAYNATGHLIVSKDGQSMTLDVTGTGPMGNPYTWKSVYDKQ